jgi:biotin carboxylase
MSPRWLVLVESNTTGSGRLYCASARELGLRPVLIARDPARYPYVALDDIDHVVADTGSAAAVLAGCRQLDGVVAGVTSSSEYFVATAAEVAAGLGLPHPDPEAVRACRDKQQQRIRLAEAGLPGPAFAAVTSPAEAAEAAEKIGFPVVVKPVSGTGSIAVRRCETAADAADAARHAFGSPDPALPPQQTVLVEEYLTGAEYSAELIDDQVAGITRKLLGPEPYFVEIGHDFPAPLSAWAAAEIDDAALAAVRALGLGWGGAHVELRLSPSGRARVVEVNPRLAGGMIPRAVQEAVGIDLIHHVVAAAAGQPVPLRRQWERSASIRFVLAAAAGTVESVHGVAAARQVPGVVEVAVTVRAGQPISLLNSFRDRLGYVIATSADAADAAIRAICVQLSAGGEP